MRIHVEINSIDELAAIFAVIRGETLDLAKLAEVSQKLRTSAVELSAKVAEVAPNP